MTPTKNAICPLCFTVTSRLATHQGSKPCRQAAEIHRLKMAGKVRVGGRFAAWLAKQELDQDFGIERAQTGDITNFGGGIQTWAPDGPIAEFLHMVCPTDTRGQVFEAKHNAHRARTEPHRVPSGSYQSPSESSAANKDLLAVFLRWMNEPEFRDGVRALVNLGGANALPTLLGKPPAKKAPPKPCRCSPEDLQINRIEVYQGKYGKWWGMTRTSKKHPNGWVEAIERCPKCKGWMKLRPEVA